MVHFSKLSTDVSAFEQMAYWLVTIVAGFGLFQMTFQWKIGQMVETTNDLPTFYLVYFLSYGATR